MKKFLTLVVLLCFCLSIGIIFNSNYVLAEEINNSSFINTSVKEINKDNKQYIIRELNDFSGKKFILYEFNQGGYAIYEKETNQFIEGSNQDKSPYLDYNGTLYYLGPLSYFAVVDNKLFNIVENKYVNMQDYNNSTYNLNYEDTIKPSYVKATNSLNSISVPQNISIADMTLIKDHFYFQNCVYPRNNDGSCAITSIGILMGYYDNYYNDDFIVNKDLVNQVEYNANSLNDIYAWEPENRGTTDAFKQYLKDKGCLHVNEFLQSVFGDYPMGELEIKNTIKDYLAYETTIPESNTIHYSGSIVNTHSKPRELLKKNIPVVLVLSKYDYQDSKKGWHTVVAYGYNEEYDTFLVNYGWGDNRKSVILSSYTCYAYYAMEYTGPHKHSSNAMGYHKFSLFGKNWKAGYARCGCGETIAKSMEIEK